ncbi:MAG: L,D-transpeptidase family protein [Pseudomonadota bacterium]
MKLGLGLTAAVLLLSGCSLLAPPQLGSDEGGRRAPVLPRLNSEPQPATVAHTYTLTSQRQNTVGRVQVIVANESDTFSDIARSYGLGYDELRLANPDIDPWLPGAGTQIILPTRFVLPDAPREGVVLNIAAKRLFYYPPVADGELPTVSTYPIGIGREGWATPVGVSKIIAKAKDPAWYVPASVRKEHREAGDPLPAVVPAGPDNPLGRHVLKLDMPGYLLHGTNQPYGVGMRVSHGCVRLYPEDIEVLYSAVGLGVSVTLVNQPVLAGWQDAYFFIKAYPPLADDERDAAQLAAAALAHARARFGDTVTESFDAAVAQIATTANARAVRWEYAGIDALTDAVLVENVTRGPQEGPSREEVLALIDEVMQDEDAPDGAASSAASSDGG